MTINDKQKRSIFTKALGWAVWIIGAVILALLVNRVVIVNAKVISGSMEQTIMTYDRVLGTRLEYLFREPSRLEVVVILNRNDPDGLPFVKRIIGLPGETIEIVDGQVFVDNKILDESDYLSEDMRGDFGPFFVPEGEFFVMGDNRNISDDSRFWEPPFVPTEDILGRVSLRIFPEIRLIR